MGLDNMPHTYPCSTQGTAVLVTIPVNIEDPNSDPLLDDSGKPVQKIDCQATQLAGGCPWKNANPPSEGAVVGLFGTDCWYRGKYGNALLDRYTDADPMGDSQSFYGDDEDSSYKNPESCLFLADLIDAVLADWPDNQPEEFPEEHHQGLVYAAWYLRWAAENCDGLDAWW